MEGGQSVCRGDHSGIWEEHSRVPCFHVISRCSDDSTTTSSPTAVTATTTLTTTTTTKTDRHPDCERRPCVRNTPSHPCERGDCGRPHHHHQNHHAQQNLHHHHHHHHHHHELHSCSSVRSTSRWASISSFSSQVSAKRLLRVLVFILSWAAVCAAPRRTEGGSVSRYATESKITNSLTLLLSRNFSNQMSAIPASEVSLPLSPPRSPETDARETTSASVSPSASTITTGRGPFASVDDLMDSVSRLPGAFPSHMSHRVAFSAERPRSPPWPSDVTFDSSDEESVDEEEEEEEEDVANSNSTHSRRRRSNRSHDLEEVCPSSSAWGKKTWALDVYKKNVTILSRIQTAGRGQVEQWFYETSCENPNHRCKGIDTYFFESYCLSKYAWVYAMIRTEAGEEGWNWIRINASCNCAIRRRSHHGHGHCERCRVDESISRRR